MFSDALGLAVGYQPPADSADRVPTEVDYLNAPDPLVLVVNDVHHANADYAALLLGSHAIRQDLPAVQLLVPGRLPSRDISGVLAGQRQMLLSDGGLANADGPSHH